MLQEIVSRKTKDDLEILEKAEILKDFILLAALVWLFS